VLVALALCSTVCHAGFTVNAVGAPSRSLAWTPTLDVLPSHLSLYQKVWHPLSCCALSCENSPFKFLTDRAIP
jgi:hypothetical protein